MAQEVKLTAKPGEVEFPKGLEGIIARESTKSFVDGQKGWLIYHGFTIEELCKNSTFEEVSYLLLHDKLPTKAELDAFTGELKQYREIPDGVYDLIASAARYNVHPMAILRTAVSALALYDDEADDASWDAQERKALKLISRMATISAAIGRARRDLEFIHPRSDLGHAANFLYMLLGEEPDDLLERVMDVILILHADHGCNASTFTSIVIASSQSDLYSAVTGGIGSLKGPLHGGANERAMAMLDEIGEPEEAERKILDKIAKKEKIMGFGHRVYKAYDPRAAMLKGYAEEITKRAGTEKWLRIAEIIERVMIEKLGKKGIFPNVDFYSGVVMSSMGIERALFTPIFATARVSGWVAHVLEQLADNRIFRPRFIYTGPMEEKYVPLEERS